MEDPAKAEEFDKLHSEKSPRWGRHHAGAKELASGYTAGRDLSVYRYNCPSVVLYRIVSYRIVWPAGRNKSGGRPRARPIGRA